MTSSVYYLPVWKANATPAERLQELVLIAEKHPEWFGKFVMAYTETKLDGKTETRYHCFNCLTPEAIGLMEIAKTRLYKDTSE